MIRNNRMTVPLAVVGMFFGLAASAGSWEPYEGNPVLGNAKLGTCFDVNVVTDGPAPYTMYFSWRPRKAIALVRGEDGFKWTQEPEICLEADRTSGWEEDLNRSCTVKKDGIWHMWYTGQAWNNEKKTMMSRIGYATSTDGVRFTRVRKTPVMVPETDFEKFSVMNPYVRWDEARKVWRMWYAAGETYEPNVLCYAESKDGLAWTKSDRNPIFEHGSPLAWDRARIGACEVHPLADGRWAMFYIGYSDIDTARIGCAISKDGVTGWTRLGQNPIVAPDLGTWNGSACYKPSVVRDEKNSRWLLWYNGRNGCPEYIGMAIHKGLDLEAPAAAPSDTKALLKTYVARFNAKDVDLVTNAIPNAEAEAFMLANCPRFACPDKDIERTYYFRWWTFRKHLRKGEKGQWRVSEFLPKVEWSGADNTIVCPAGHHFREGRWLRDPQYIRDLSRFWLSDKEAKHRWNYSSWLYTGVCAFAEVSGEDELAAGLLDAAVSYYETWEKGVDRWLWDQKPEAPLRMGGDGKGLFLSSRSHEGSEFTLTPSGYRPLFNAAMWSEANAISKMAAKLGRTELAKRFADKADAIVKGFEKTCWNEKLGFFVSADPKGVQCPVRELHGYAPWYFGMPTAKRPDWAQLSDPQGFAATYGLTFPERRAKGFRIAYDAHECLWDGPVWPFATSIALTALANDLHSSPSPSPSSSPSSSPSPSLFTSLLWQYADSQRLTHPSPWSKGVKGDWEVVPWIDENNHPDKPEWLARQIMLDRPDLGAKFPKERGKDYNHSTFCDLVISGLVGFVPNGDGFSVRPLFPETWDYLVLENLRYRGHDIDIRWRRGRGLTVFVDGREEGCGRDVRLTPVAAAAGSAVERDIVVYGSSPAAISAAVQARRMGLSCVVVSPETRIGGLTTGGLGQTDIGNKSAFGGIALEFYRDVAKWYRDDAHWTRQKRGDYLPDGQCTGSKGDDSMWTFEPSAALAILEGWEKRDGLDIRRGKRLDRAAGKVKVKGEGEQRRIDSLVTEDGTVFRGKMFVDATYEGDLMAAAGVSYTVGREANDLYGETLSGCQRKNAVHHQIRKGVSGYVKPGDPASGFLPGVMADDGRPDGAGDGFVQAYCFRMCLTDDPANRIPFAKPANYDERLYELLFRHLEADPKFYAFDLTNPGQDWRLPWINSKMPNRKTDTNNRDGFSSDFIGQNWNWAEGSYAERAKMLKAHLDYQRGLMWTLANHPRVPEGVRAAYSRWGTCRDEFKDGLGDGWQSQLYVREARRMVGEYVMTEAHCRGKKAAGRPVAMAAYTMDSHHVRRIADKDGCVMNEGDVQIGHDEKGRRFPPYPIDYGAIVPKRGECANLFVPVCVSASHIAFGSIRMEPVFFALGQAAGTAAALAAERGCAVQDLDYAPLAKRLRQDGQVIGLEAGR